MTEGAPLTVVEFTDPACPWAWGSEPKFRWLRAALDRLDGARCDHQRRDHLDLEPRGLRGIGEVSYQPFPKGYVGYNAALDGICAYDGQRSGGWFFASERPRAAEPGRFTIKQRQT